MEREVCGHPILQGNGGREGAFIGAVHRGRRWRSQCPGPRGSGLGGQQGLDKGEASRSWDTAAFLVVLKELLQSLHVERVIVVNFLLGGVQALGHRDGVPHCRERGDRGEGGALLPAQLTAAFFPGDGHSPTVVMGLARGSRPQELAEKSPRPQKMQGEKPMIFLKVS